MLPNPLAKRYAPSGMFWPGTLNILSTDEYCYSTGLKGGPEIVIVATVITCVSSALQFVAGLICLRALWVLRRKSRPRLANYLILHTSALEVANLIGLVTAIIGLQWFLGPIAFFNANLWKKRTCDPNHTEHLPPYPKDNIFWEEKQLYARIVTLGRISDIALGTGGLLSDAMLIWRCRQIWSFTLFPRPNLIIILPLLLLVGSIAPLGLSCMKGFFTESSRSSLAYFVITLALNIILTSLIVSRLWYCKLQLRETLGDGYGKHYDILSIVFVESAFMNAVCSILLLASSLWVVNPNISQTMGMMLDIWLGVTPAVQACSNYLIIYRGTKGWYGSWSSDATITNPSIAVFGSVFGSSTSGRMSEHDEYDDFPRDD
ncbi:hypothetical protein QCA50_016988 [Cerrena zonata]|uniref:Uncharacterized protein n=1 Tax=Cerrena zonata TaxID=2478898 RepID=A0AAW0FL47_9APHY